MLGISRGFSEFPAPYDLQIPHLNAPFGADWNDYPHTEKLFFYLWGSLLRVFSVGVAANLMMLLAHSGATLSFVWSARRLGVRSTTAIAGALLLAFNYFMLGRGLGHLNIISIWHVPLLVYLVIRVASNEPPPATRIGRVAFYLVMAGCSLYNPYYPPLFMQLLALAVLRARFAKRQASARFGAIALAAGVGTFMFGQLNVFLRAHRDGPNSTFSGRHLEDMRMWSLRLPDLFMPVQHPIASWQEFAAEHYFGAGNPASENTFAFLGAVGCVLLVWLAARAFSLGLRARLEEVPAEAWIVAYILLFSLSGGLDYLLGAIGITWLRAVNRHSIVILCCLLLWGGRTLDSYFRDWRGALVTAAALGIGIAEAFGMRPLDFDDQTRIIARTVHSDQRFAHTLERRLPEGAAIFQLPIMGFPEAEAIVNMTDYEHFRPYLWTESLRYSYGTHKGRPREDWQTLAAGLPPAQMVEYVAEKGFRALYINRKGFADRAAALEAELKKLGLAELVTSPDHDLVAYRIPRPHTS